MEMSETTTIEVGGSTAGGSVTAAVVEGIATVSDCDPMEIDVHLRDYVDPDALDTLFGDGRGSGDSTGSDGVLELTATLDGYEVTVHSCGYVTVTRRAVSEESGEVTAET